MFIDLVNFKATAGRGGDGLVKVWTIKTNECIATLDQHTEKVACSNIMQVAVRNGTIIIMGFNVCSM